jgi:hypothetical protein
MGSFRAQHRIDDGLFLQTADAGGASEVRPAAPRIRWRWGRGRTGGGFGGKLREALSGGGGVVD